MLRSLKAVCLATAAAGCFLFFWCGSSLLSWAVLPLVRLLTAHRSALERTRACQDIVGLGFRLFLGAMRLTRTVVFHPRRVRLVLPDRPCVLVANHPTLIDITAIMAVHPRICCVAKSELFDSVLVGPLLRYCGHINGGGDGPLDGLSVIPQAIDRLDQGHSVLIFPEGTRSPAYGLRRFKPGAFEICRRAEVPAVPVLITCDPPALLRGLSWYALLKTTSQYRIRQLPTLSKDALSGDSRRIAREVQELFQEQLDTLRDEVSRSEESPSSDSQTSHIPLGEDANHARS